MTSKEQVMSRLALNPIGGTPVFPRDLTLGLDALDISTEKIFKDEYNADLAAKAVLALQKITHHDAVVGCIHSAGFNVECFGGEMRYPERGIPYVQRHPFSSPDDFYKFKEREYDYTQVVRSYDIVKSSSPDLAVFGNLEAPVTRAGIYRGLENLMMDLSLDQTFALEIVELGVERAMSYIEKLAENQSADAIFFAAASDNPDMIGPEVYESITLKYMSQLINKIHKLGLPVVFHPHGDFSSDELSSTLDKTIDLGIDGFQFAEQNDHNIILQHTKNRCCILGGINVTDSLLLGPDERIINDCNKYMKDLSKEDYIFMCSCSLHRGISIKNVKTMVSAVKEFDSK